MYPKLKTIFIRGRNILTYGKYIPTEFFVDHEKQLVYIPIPKIACTTIKHSLYANVLSCGQDHNDYMNLHSQLATKQQYNLSSIEASYFKFAFVRDPFTRLVSCFKDKVKKPKQHNGKYFFDTAYNKQLIRLLFRGSFHMDMSFEEFVKLVSKIPDVFSDGHFMSQTAFLYRRNRILPDFVGRLEHIDEDWKVLAKRFDLPPLEVKNETESADISKYYTEEMVEIVYQRYKHDIHNLGYMDSYRNLLEKCK